MGEKEKALDYLEPLLENPYYLSTNWLRIDPNLVSQRDIQDWKSYFAEE